MLENILESYPPIAYNFAYYYLNGCEPESRPLVIDVLAYAITETREAAAGNGLDRRPRFASMCWF